MRNYLGGKCFKGFLTALSCLANGPRRDRQFHGRPRDSERRSALRNVIALWRKCRAAKWANLMPGTRPYRPVQQIHGLRPFFQHNPRGAFRASAANIGVHRGPPTASGNNRIGRHARIATNQVRRITASQTTVSGPFPLYVFANSIQYSGTLRASGRIAYRLKSPGSLANHPVLHTAIPLGMYRIPLMAVSRSALYICPSTQARL